MACIHQTHRQEEGPGAHGESNHRDRRGGEGIAEEAWHAQSEVKIRMGVVNTGTGVESRGGFGIVAKARVGDVHPGVGLGPVSPGTFKAPVQADGQFASPQD